MSSDFEGNGKEDSLLGASASPILRYVVPSLILMLLLTGGVYWVRLQPTSAPDAEQGTAVQVRLLPTTEPAVVPLPVPQPTPLEKAGSSLDATTDRSDTPADDAATHPPVPEATAASVPVEDAQAKQDAKAKTNQVAAKFQEMLMRHIARFERYPTAARKDGLEGTTQVVFVMRRDGSVLDAWVTSSSGQILLDTEAVDVIHRAEPLPTIPDELPGQLSILIPIAFSLH